MKTQTSFYGSLPHGNFPIGPLSQVWCMRLEGKHRELKQYSKNITSRVNLPLSLMTKQQLKFEHRILSQKGLHVSIITGPSPSSLFPALENLQMFTNKEYMEHKWIKINKILYSPGMMIRTKNDVFCEIKSCIGFNGSVVFVLYRYDTISFSPHYQAYMIHFPDNPSIICHITVMKILARCQLQNTNSKKALL